MRRNGSPVPSRKHSISIYQPRLFVFLLAILALGVSVLTVSTGSASSGKSAANEKSDLKASASSAALLAPQPIFTYSDTIIAAGPTFVRPIANGNLPPIALSSQTQVHWSAFAFTVDTTGTYVLTNLSNTFNTPAPNDSFLILYISSFNPASPLTNALVANDNGPAMANRAQITRTLIANTVYVLVTSPFSSFSSPGVPSVGSFTNEINGPGTTTSTTQCPFITISPTSLPPGSIGVPYSQTLVATGGTGPYTYSVSSGALPPGLSLVSDTIAGTPTTAGNFSFTVTATDANGCVGSQAYLIVVTDPTVQNCYSDSLNTGDPTFARPSITDSQPSGIPAGGCVASPSGTAVFYKTYEFDVSGCSTGTLTATLCDGAGCGPVTGGGALANSAIYLYRTGGLTAGTGAANAFSPGASCTNLVSANDNLNGTVSSGGLLACSANTNLSGLRRTVGPGRVTIVVAGVNNGQTGAYNLQVSAPGCTITPVPACQTINGTVTPSNQTICPGASATVSVSVSGGTPPYTVSLNNGGGTMTGTGPFNFTVTPASTTTYTATGTDLFGCPITMSGTATVTVSDTTPPTVSCPADSSASADANCQAAIPDYASAATTSDNCSGVVTKTQSPAAGTLVGPGSHVVTVTATDASGNTNSCTTTFTVTDNTPPTVTCPAGTTASADASCQAAVPDYASSATTSDNCPGAVTKTQSPAAGTMVGLGPHVVTVTATDAAGNTNSCQTTFTVVDTTGPSLSFTTTTLSMWPPNHAYHTFNAASFGATAGDACGGVGATGIYIVSVTSDEVENGGGDGNTLNDIVIAADCKSVQLRAERQNNGDGRVYTIVFGVTDSSGNVTTGSVTVTVPTSQNGAGAVDSGPQYGKTCP